MTKSKKCSECREGRLHPSTWDSDFRHYDSSIHVTGLQSYLCDVCGADPVFRDQIIYNEKRIADVKRNATGRMTGRDVRRVREKLGLTQQEAAVLFGGGANAFSKYERGEVMQSLAIDRLLRLVAESPGLLDRLRVFAESDCAHRHRRVAESTPDYRAR